MAVRSSSSPLARDVIAAARAWVGTPYRHASSRRGVGCDCLGLVRGVWEDVSGVTPPLPEPYSPDWAELRDDEPLLGAARRHLVPAEPVPGAVLVFRWSPHAAAKHCGVLVGHDRLVHAYSGVGTVESALVPAWRRRIVGAFAFPGMFPGTGTANDRSV